MIEEVAIVGFGRFGKTLYRLLKDDFKVTIFNRSDIDPGMVDSSTVITNNVAGIYATDKKRAVFFCVPIPAFENVIREHKKYFTDKHVLIDTLSVKSHAEKVFRAHLKDTKTEALLTHPMFGPDSSKDGFAGLPIIIDRFLANQETYDFWKHTFKRKGLRVVEMPAKEHDKLAANSQGLTHFIGRLFKEFDLQSTPIDSIGSKKLHEIMEQTCNDTWELFLGLQNYNPYTKQMRLKLGKSYDNLYNRLLPTRISGKYLVFGIQGGKGSFNEQALEHYVEQERISRYKVRYLYTTERVLSELHKGNIDYGQFAIHNSVGGIVDESIRAIAHYKFKIVSEYGIKIEHHLVKRPDVSFNEIKTIMAHDQVFKQCQNTLAQKYPDFKQVTGKGNLIDTAMAAKALSEGKIDKKTAILGPKVLSSLFNLEIVASNLQDNQDNYTSFMVVKRM